MNIELLEVAESTLGALVDQVVFVGGATVGLWITDPAAPPVYMLAMKVEAFKGRGNGDFLGSRDFGDIVMLIDGRPELPEEVAEADADVRAYIAEEMRRLLAKPRLMDGLAGWVRGDAASRDRVELVILPAIEALAESTA